MNAARGRLVQNVAPTVHPVSLAEAKAFLRLDSTDDDVLVAELINAATKLFEMQTGRQICTATWTLYLDEWPRSGLYDGAPLSREIELPRSPLASVSSIKYLDTAGVEQTFSASNYSVEAGLSQDYNGRLWLKEDVSVPDMGSYPGALRVAFVAGYGAAGACPEPIKAAVKLLVQHLYDQRRAVAVGNIVNQMPFSLQALVDGYRVGGAAVS